MSGYFFLLFLHILSIFISKKIFQNFTLLCLGQMWATKATNASPGGPDTQDNPHETGAMRKAAQPLCVQKNHFKNYHKLLNF